MTPRQHARLIRKEIERHGEEAQRRARSGKWAPWEQKAVVDGDVGGDGWTREIRHAHQNGVYAVLTREVATPWGTVIHASIHSAAAKDIPWRDKQRIKAELFGAERLAVEVFPPASSTVDQAMAYHLWVLPEGFALPFGLTGEDAA